MLLSPEYLEDLFDNFQPGAILVQEIRDFYGPTFKIERHDTPDGASTYCIDASAENLRVHQAIVRLNTTTDRVVEAATHELLHLRQPIRGFQLVQKVYSNPAQQLLADHVNTVVRSIINIIDHDIFVREFVGMGLPLSRFLARRQEIPRYDEEAKSYRGKILDSELAWVAWSWWSFEFLNNFVSIEHGDEQAQFLAERTLRAGTRALPGFDKNADQIRAWIGKGKHRHKDTYIEAMQELMKLVHLPQIESFVLLAKDGRDGPKATSISVNSMLEADRRCSL